MVLDHFGSLFIGNDESHQHWVIQRKGLHITPCILQLRCNCSLIPVGFFSFLFFWLIVLDFLYRQLHYLQRQFYFFLPK